MTMNPGKMSFKVIKSRLLFDRLAMVSCNSVL